MIKQILKKKKPQKTLHWICNEEFNKTPYSTINCIQYHVKCCNSLKKKIVLNEDPPLPIKMLLMINSDKCFEEV